MPEYVASIENRVIYVLMLTYLYYAKLSFESKPLFCLLEVAMCMHVDLHICILVRCKK